MAKYIINIPDEVPVSDELVPFDMCRPSWYWEAYKKGKADTEDNAWEFAMTCLKMDGADFYKCFGDSMVDCLTKLSYKEAKDKYELWKAEREQIRVGDEVEYECCGELVTFVVTGTDGKRAYGFNIFCDFDDVGEYCDIEDLRKTGRSFPEIADVLKKMMEE